MEIPGAALGGLAALAAAVGGGIAWAFRQPGQLLADHRATIDRQRADLERAEAEAARLRGERNELREEVETWRRRRAEVLSGASRILDADVLTSALDYAECGIVISAPGEDSARWTWVSQSVVRALGAASMDEVLALGWRHYMHPADVAKAVRIEGSAHAGPVRGQVFRYRMPGGGWQLWRWRCSGYGERPSGAVEAACLVRFLGPAPGLMRVLVAEDDAQLRRSLQNELEMAGVVVADVVASGEEAISAASRLRPDVVLMDLDLPGIGGAEATRQIVALWPEARVVILTKATDPGAALAARAAGAVEVLIKPVEQPRLLAALARAAQPRE